MIKTDFIKLYEELSTLNEAKADTQKLVDFAGQELADRFLAIKSRLKAPENDLYYWIKKNSVEELEAAVANIESSKSSTETKKEIADEGAKLVAETDDWKVYEITTFAAAQQYGRDTKWCITGVDGKGDFYWNDYYTNRGVKFYFFITKKDYNARGTNSKYALAIWPKKKAYEIYDQQDDEVTLSEVPFIKNIRIPGVSFSRLKPYYIPREPDCDFCGFPIYMQERQPFKFLDNDTKFCHTECWYKKFKPELVPELTEYYIFQRFIGGYRKNTVKPYDEALKDIISMLSITPPDMLNQVILYWKRVEPYKNIVTIDDGKFQIDDEDAGKQVKKALGIE